ncbi:type II secretion system F family protein [Streptomyces sp. NPDC047928]|uniref:type II secretion system F family protein n=1 Tax=unclassified Streptomyces TaxID=2593676 RepID=UPI00371F4638
MAAWRRRRRVRGRLDALLAGGHDRGRDRATGQGQGRERGRGRRRVPRLAWWPVSGAAAGRWAMPLAAAVIGWMLVGGVAGCVVGAVAAYGVRRWRLRPRPVAEDGAVARQLALAADLLAACLSAGAGPREAAEAVGASLGGPVGERLSRAAAELGLGGDPAEAWGRLGAIPGARELARCLERAAASGAPAAGPVSRVAAALRAERARESAARAQRAQVLITAPVGLCFLPAFLAVGVAPVVMGLASELL